MVTPASTRFNEHMESIEDSRFGSAQEKLQFSNILLTAGMEASPDGILIVDTTNTQIILFNRRFIDIMGIPPGLVHTGMDISVLATTMASMRDPQKNFARAQYLDGEDEAGYDELVAKDGRLIERHGVVLNTPSDQHLGRAWFFRDITKRREAKEQIIRLAYCDALTGLANRRLFTEQIQQEIARAIRNGKRLALLYLDLGHFKDIIAALGRQVGDRLLRAVGERLKTSIRQTDIPARLGGDKFAVLQPDIRGPMDTAALAESLLNAFRVPFTIQGNEIHVSISVGISLYKPDASTVEALMSHASMALHKAKSEEHGTYRFFTDTMDAEVRTRVTLSTELRSALAQNQLFLLYQPQVETETGRITGIEALVRWHHPEYGVLGPYIFLPIAEESDLAAVLSHWVMHEACRQAKEWLDAGIMPRVMAVNIASMRFKSPLELEKDIIAILAETGLPPSRLELELTESGLLEVSLDRNAILRQFRRHGIHISIDDFGTGYSSLDYLSRSNADRIKIAQSFILDLETKPENGAIVRTIIRLAEELDLNLIAEGVETEKQLAMLSSWGCREAQGFYFSKPLTFQDLTPLLQKGSIPMPPASGSSQAHLQ